MRVFIMPATSTERGHYEVRCGVCQSVRPSVACLSLLLLVVRGPREIPVTQGEIESVFSEINE